MTALPSFSTARLGHHRAFCQSPDPQRARKWGLPEAGMSAASSEVLVYTFGVVLRNIMGVTWLQAEK